MTFHPSVTSTRVQGLLQRDNYLGLCVACGEEAHGVEPDARRYICEACGKRSVYGAEEMLFMGIE